MATITGNSLKNSVELLKCMNEVVAYLDDDRAYESWIWTVPDGADDDDYESIAEDSDEMDHVCRSFRQIVGHYGKDGWCTAALEADGHFGHLQSYGADAE